MSRLLIYLYSNVMSSKICLNEQSCELQVYCDVSNIDLVIFSWENSRFTRISSGILLCIINFHYINCFKNELISFYGRRCAVELLETKKNMAALFLSLLYISIVVASKSVFFRW